eukprot:COSAG06_NODE_54772_length_293_cov_0.494845_1_plen_25_part_01
MSKRVPAISCVTGLNFPGAKRAKGG